MSRRILKFDATSLVKTADEPRWLHVEFQGVTLMVWCEATPLADDHESPGVVSYLSISVTGGDVPSGEYIGTAQHPTMLAGRPFVAHVYARRA